MLHILASLQLENGVEAEKNHCMVAKLVGRMLKLELDNTNHEPGLVYLEKVLKKAKTHLEQRWATIRRAMTLHTDVSPLKGLKFGNDAILHLPELDVFLRQLSAKVPQRAGTNFSPTLGFRHFPSRSLPELKPCSKDSFYHVYGIFSLETWFRVTCQAGLRVISKTQELAGLSKA